jgi:T5SS/PEP-CTERM-associated repeat protein
VVAFLLGTGGSASGQFNYSWNTYSGSFQNAANWTPTNGGGAFAPGPIDIATIARPTAIVTADADWTVLTLNLYGPISLEMNGRTLTTSNLNTSVYDGGAIIGRYAGNVQLSDGTLRVNGPVNLAGGFANNQFFTGTMTLDHATFSATSNVILAADAATYNLNVTNGSTFAAVGIQGSYIASTGNAFVTVDGVGSSFSIGTGSRIGNSGQATVNVQEGGAMHTTGALNLATAGNSNARITLTDTGSSWTHIDGFITTGAGAGGAGIFVNAGTSFTMTGTSTAAGIVLGANSGLTVNGTATVSGISGSGITVNSGGTLAASAPGSITTPNLTRSGTGVLSINGGTLIVDGGTLDNGVGQFNLTAAGGGIFQLQNGGTTTGVTEVNVSRPSGASPMLKVLSGSTFTSTSIISVGGLAGTGAVVVDGTGSVLTTSLGTGIALIIGGNSGGVGTLTVQNGGHYVQNTSTTGLLGSNQSSSGTVTVTGVGSRFDAGNLSIGTAGIGSLSVSAGGSATTAKATIAEQSSSNSSVTVTGPGSTWAITAGASGLYIGGTSTSGGGTGGLNVTNGGAVTVIGTTKVWDNGTLNVNGGSFTTGGLTRVGTLSLQNGTLTVDGALGPAVFNNGPSPSNLIVQSSDNSTVATFRLIDGATTTNVSGVFVGASSQGALVLASGAQLNATSIFTATVAQGSSSISLTGSGTSLTTTGAVTLGGAFGGPSALSIGAGSTVTAGTTLTLANGGTVNMNGGTLTMAALTASGGSFNWTSGRVIYSGTSTVDGPQIAALLGTGGSLTTGRTLGSSGTMFLSGNLTVAGGQFTGTLLNSGSLAISAGSVQAGTGGFSNSGTTAISGGVLDGGAGGLGNSGQMALTSQAATVTTVGGFSNSGLLSVTAGTVAASGINNLGEIQLGGSGAVVGPVSTTLTNTGRIDGVGRINNDLANNANGVIAVDAGQRLVFGGGTNVNNSNGAISLTGGTVEFTAPLTNAAGGFISGRGTFRGNSASSLVFDSNPGDPPVIDFGLKNTGVVAFSGGFSDVYGKVNNLGGGYDVNHVFVPAGGQIITAGGGTTTFHDDVVNNGLEIRTSAGARTVFLGGVSGAAPYTGTGTVEYQGDLRPGNSPDIVHYSGNLVFASSARLTIEMEGYPPGANGFDQLVVDGSVDLGGAPLALSFLNGFVPTFGSQFEIIDHTGAGPIMNTFAGLAEGSTFTSAGVTFGISYAGGDGNDVVLTTIGVVPEPGSFALVTLAAAAALRLRRRPV